MQILGQFAASSYAGTAAAVTVTCGFQPVFIIAYNETDGDVAWVYISGLAAGKALQITNHDTAQLSVLSSNGFTVSANGFTAGTSLSESGKTIRYFAV